MSLRNSFISSLFLAAAFVSLGTGRAHAQEISASPAASNTSVGVSSVQFGTPPGMLAIPGPSHGNVTLDRTEPAPRLSMGWGNGSYEDDGGYINVSARRSFRLAGHEVDVGVERVSGAKIDTPSRITGGFMKGFWAIRVAASF